ncbi:hypothetical protein [Rathayibacter rathayi]|nr:hypothetical protein [Rathayibacter rathayi]MWV75087.1 hypothetical protein [Rathayibacter rathayi NCPPB 2980 = VKM Ac-1601]TWD64228.1 hypothetical protein FB469_2703 [Rathayibacter rathayi]SOE03946.1 hypothetical protein SAMN06295924_10385 [Rathayibacter rathayi NCPPB 2980 = VKM Ac-1601]
MSIDRTTGEDPEKTEDLPDGTGTDTSSGGGDTDTVSGGEPDEPTE